MLSSMGLGLGLAFTAGYLSRPTRLAAAVRLDQGIGARGALAAAFELGAEDAGTGYVALLRASAESRLAGLELRKVLPLPKPRSTGLFALTFAAFLAALLIEPGTKRVPRAVVANLPPAAEAAAPPLSGAELALLAKRAERLLAGAKSDEGRRRALDYAALVQGLERGTIDRKQALSAIAAVEREVSAPGSEGEQPASQQPSTASERGQADGPPREQDRNAQLKDAAEALRRLAERLAQETAPPTARELERIRETLERTREQTRRTQAAAAEQTEQSASRLREKERRLLAKKDDGTLTGEEAAELEQTRRQLERLERQKREQAQAQSELDRQLAEAMRELSESRQQASEFADRAAASLEKEAGKQLTDEEKRELLEQLRALKERLRQGEESDMAEQLRQFERRAGGRQSQEGQGEGQGQPGPAGRRTLSPALGRSAESGESGAETVQLGQSTSKDPGTEHDPNWQGQASERLGAKTQDKAAAARDSGAGQSDSETILTAAEQGFTTGAYEKLYKDYQTVLEETVSGETIPRGRRSEVERYFELIRPREH